MKDNNVKFKDFNGLHESIVSILDPLIGGDHSSIPFSGNDIIKTLVSANLDKKPETIKKAIGMLDVLVDYVKTLGGGKSNSTIKGIESVKKSLQDALDKFTENK